ncbi:hypothetical protein JW960_18375 [candidate division KSB1 bacterium]|nr:hypothetical protein [candidate division KSB1 bacterium]
MNRTAVIILIILFIFSNRSTAQPKYAIDFLFGDARCLPSFLKIEQAGFDNIQLTAHYKTNSFQQPYYYSFRVSYRANKMAWEIEMVHLKIELLNNPSPVQHFEISHGYNLITLNRIHKVQQFAVRIGGGIVLAHPENSVRKQTLDETNGLIGLGYYIAGPTAQFCIEKCIGKAKNFEFSVEGKCSASYASVPVVDGRAHVPLFVLHGLLGIRYCF